MAVKDYKNELEKMYSQIYSCEGKCKCFDECSKNMPNGKEINCCKLKLGNDYGKGIPKIMFVGKEGVNSAQKIESPQKVSEARHNNSHYFGTILTLAYMLKKIDGNMFVKENKSQEFLSNFDYLCSKMCLTNYYKCAFRDDDKNHNIRTNGKMKKHCPIILAREIETLKPNIIIIQGKFTTRQFYENELLKICKTIQKNPIYKSSRFYISVDKYEYVDSKEPLYIIWSYHPSSHGHWDSSLKELKSAIDAIKL